MKQLRESIKDKAIEAVERKVSTYKPFETIIDIYVDLIMHQKEFKSQLSEHEEYSDGYNILTQALNELEGDIKAYQERLMID